MIDNKEQVIEFELTEKGKQQLMLGKFNPTFYSFSDDDILYNSNFANFDEHQNDTEGRIFSTSRLNLNARISGAETALKEISRMGDEEVFLDIEQEESERTYMSHIALGNADTTDNAPAWSMKAWAGQIKKVDSVIDDPDTTFIVRIPQITFEDSEYKLSKVQNMPDNVFEEMEQYGYGHSDDTIVRNEDGTVFEMERQDIFIDINEFNSMFKNTNFSLEVFEVVEFKILDKKKEFLRQVYFSTPSFEPGDLYEEQNNYNMPQGQENNLVYIDTYLTIEVDGEIDPAVVCKYVPRDKRRGVYDPNNYECEEKTDLKTLDAMRQNTADPSEGDDC